MNRRIQGFLLGLIVAIALPVWAYKVTDTSVTFGTNGDVTLSIGGGQIKWNNSESKLEKSNDGGATSEELGTAGKVKFDKTQSMEFHTGNGEGSTNTLIRKFTTLASEKGGGVYTHNHGGTDSTNGLEITMVKDARVQGTWCDQSNNTWVVFGLSVNATPATNANSLTYATGLRGKTDIPTSDDYKCHPFDFIVSSGDVLRPHTSSATILIDGVSTYFSFKATSIETVDSVSLILAHEVGSLSFDATAGCVWEVTSTGWTDFPVDNDCDDNARTVTGDVTDGSAGLQPQVTIPNVYSSGSYKITARGQLKKESANNHYCEYRFSDGVTSSSPISIGSNGSVATGHGEASGIIRFPSDATNVTIKFQAKSSLGASECEYRSDFTKAEITVEYIPNVSSSEIAIPQRVDVATFFERNDTATDISANSWQALSLNTAINADFSSHSGDEWTLDAGRYLLRGGTGFYMSANAIGVTSFRLYDVTNTVSFSDNLGTCSSYPISGTYGGAPRYCVFTPTIIDIATETTFRIEVYGQNVFSNGTGHSGQGGVIRVRSQVSIMKL